jgi:hypothetical protein
MIATGLREELINTLEVIGDALPDIRKEIWQRVKKMLRTVVSETQTHRVELAYVVSFLIYRDRFYLIIKSFFFSFNQSIRISETQTHLCYNIYI